MRGVKKRTDTPLSDARVVSTSFVVSIFDILLNLIVGIVTNSVVMFSQALQGLSDLVTAGVLLFGVRSSKRVADDRHPFGYGREIFFWVLIAGIMMFLVTGCLSIYLGWHQFQKPNTISNVGLAFGMLVFGLVSNFYAFSQSAKRLNQAEGAERWWQRLVDASTVETKATFLIDFLGTAAAGLGLIALTAYVLTGNVRFDGIGAILVGTSMAIGSVLLIKDVKGLIVGRSVTDAIADDIKKAALSVEGVRAVLDLRTMYMGSAKLLIIIEVHLDDDLSTNHIEQLIDKIKHTILTKVPHAYHVQVEVETPDSELV